MPLTLTANSAIGAIGMQSQHQVNFFQTKVIRFWQIRLDLGKIKTKFGQKYLDLGKFD